MTRRHGARQGHQGDCPAVEAATRSALAWAGMITALATGAFLGLSCGLAPGPLLALLLAQTLRHGPREGCKIALTRLVTDAPIILVALMLAAKLEELRPLLGIVSIAGGAFVLYLAWDSFRAVRLGAEAPAERTRSWFKGIFTNLLSPHPWLFWLTVGAAILAEAIAQSWLVAVAFLFGFCLLAGRLEGGGSSHGRTVPRPAGRAALAGGHARPCRAAGGLCHPAVPRGIKASGADLTVPDWKQAGLIRKAK